MKYFHPSSVERHDEHIQVPYLSYLAIEMLTGCQQQQQQQQQSGTWSGTWKTESEALGEGFFICWITLYQLKFFSSAITKKRHGPYLLWFLRSLRNVGMFQNNHLLLRFLMMTKTNNFTWCQAKTFFFFFFLKFQFYRSVGNIIQQIKTSSPCGCVNPCKTRLVRFIGLRYTSSFWYGDWENTFQHNYHTSSAACQNHNFCHWFCVTRKN